MWPIAAVLIAIATICHQTNAQSGLIQEGALQWSQIYAGYPSPTPWLGTYGSAVTVTSAGRLLVVGGMYKNNSQTTNNIQPSSTGGVTFTKTVATQFPPRFHHSCTLTSTGSLLLIGGFNYQSGQLSAYRDTWMSVEGDTWSAGSQMPWSRGRGGHIVTSDSTSLVLYVTGGLTVTSTLQQTMNDVWKTQDSGLTWQIATLNAPFRGRAFHGAVVRQGVLFVAGGATYYENHWHGLDDVWTSIDQGSTFIEMAATLPYSPLRFMSSMICYGNDDIYIIGGIAVNPYFQPSNTLSLFSMNPNNTINATAAASAVQSDVWLSSDAGLSWTRPNPTSVFGPRFDAQSAIIGQKLIVVGGVDSQNAYLNDIWSTVLPMASNGNDGTILAAIMGVTSGLFLIAIVVLRRWQDKFAVPNATVSGRSGDELMKLKSPA